MIYFVTGSVGCFLFIQCFLKFFSQLLLVLCNFISTMLLRCAVLLFYLNFVRTSEIIYSDLTKEAIRDVDERFSSWPSFHNGVRLMRIRKRETEVANPGSTERPVTSETPHEQTPKQHLEQSAQTNDPTPATFIEQPPHSPTDSRVRPQAPPKPEESQQPSEPPPSVPLRSNDEHLLIKGSTNASANNTGEGKAQMNTTVAVPGPRINLSDPGVVKRAFIVFGGFALLGTAYYFLFFRKKNNNGDAKNTHSSIDANQFRYGVLKSEDKMNTFESSRVPLTMESDEDDDEDLEIFDLGQKKKSLSYINLQQHDDEIVLNDSRSIDMENLLVDIEDKNSETLINWSSTGSKSIL